MFPRLRSDVQIVRTGPSQFLLRDPRSGAAFQLGIAERGLLEMLDGRTEFAALCRRGAERFGAECSPTFVEEFVNQLLAAGLLAEAGEPSPLPPAISLRPALAPARTVLPTPRPLSAEDPARGLNHVFDWLALAFGWILHPLWLVPLAGLMLLSAGVLLHNFDRYNRELLRLTDMTDFYQRIPVFFAMVLVGVSFPRALLLGMATRAFGGRVFSFGPRLERRLLPYFDCDIGDSLMRMSQGQQWALLSLGIWSQFLLGSLAIVFWALAPPRSPLGSFWLLLIPHCVLGVLLRFNPLARSDAYAMLCFATGEQQLAERAKGQARAWLLGEAAPEALPDAQRFWFRAFGLGAYAWTGALWLVLVVGGGWLLCWQMQGAGAVLGVAALGLFYSDSLRSHAMKTPGLSWLLRGGGRWYIRWPLRLAVLAAIVACGFIPYTHEVGGDFRLAPVEEVALRAPVAGQIVALNAREGQTIEANAEVVSIDPRDQRAQAEATGHELEAAKAKLELLRAGSREEEIEAARQRVELAYIRLEYYQQELSRIENLAVDDTVSKVELETAKLERDSAQKLHAAAQEELQVLLDGSRPEEIQAAEAEVHRLEALLAHYQQELSLALVRAPFAGRMVTSHVETRLGSYVQPGELIGVLQNTGKLRAEIAATEEAAAEVEPGQKVHLRFWGLHGALVTGVVSGKSSTAIDDRQWQLERVRTDREAMVEQSRSGGEARNVWVYVDLDAGPHTARLMPEMTGRARIVIRPDVFWRALSRPVLRFFRVEVWSWLP